MAAESIVRFGPKIKDRSVIHALAISSEAAARRSFPAARSPVIIGGRLEHWIKIPTRWTVT
jgi:hypothetical protein